MNICLYLNKNNDKQLAKYVRTACVMSVHENNSHKMLSCGEINMALKYLCRSRKLEVIRVIYKRKREHI